MEQISVLWLQYIRDIEATINVKLKDEIVLGLKITRTNKYNEVKHRAE